jgi:pimeloyl-ACP methyl ester carboxylesterase
VGGAFGYRAFASAIQLAELLAPRLTAISYDRRGRGDSGNTLPYAVQREVEDIEALINAAGGSANVYGVSSGAVLALKAANSLPVKVK